CIVPTRRSHASCCPARVRSVLPRRPPATSNRPPFGPKPHMEAPQQKQAKTNLVWMDLEMTGLDPAVDVILQAALIVTNAELEPLERYVVDVWQPEEALSKMVPFVRSMHEKTGLLARVRASKTELQRAEQEIL